MNDDGALKKRMKSKHRNAQLEMIGLVIIVVIVITALLIFTVYKLTHPSQNIKKSYINREIATNMLIAMENINVEECHNLTLATLLIDCAKSVHEIRCEDTTGCDVANKTIEAILTRTLVDMMDLDFKMTVVSPNPDIDVFINFNHNCSSRTAEKVQGFELLPMYSESSEQVEMNLDICVR
jgi:Na+-transporting NADH:ubiquinone oxidoreductase subunit NqrC